MASQDSPRHGRVSPINVSAPASVRGFVPLTENSTAEGRSVQYVGDANVDPLVNSEPNRSANTDTSPAQNGQPSNPSTFDDGTVPPPSTFSRSSAEGEDYTSPRGDLGDVNGHGNSGSHGRTNLGDVNIAPGGHTNSEKQRNAPILDANHLDYRPSAEKYHKCTVTENTGIDSENGSGKQHKRTHKPRDAY